MTTDHKTEIALIAEAIISSNRLIELLINKLPEPTKQAVAEKVKNANVTPNPVVTQAPVPVAVPVVPVAPVHAPVVAMAPAAPVPAQPQAQMMPPVPVFNQVVVPSPAPVVAAQVISDTAAFASKQAMMDFVISSYKALGEKGASIQGVLTGMGYTNINDVDPARWCDLKAGIEALK